MSREDKVDFLKKLTKPFVDRFVQIDKKQIANIAKGNITFSQAKLLKQFCGKERVAIPGVAMTMMI